VEETGKNSVIPSIIPSKITAIQIGIRGKDEKSAGKTSSNFRKPLWLYDYQFTDWQARRSQGVWWQRRLLGGYFPSVILKRSGEKMP
jgi:hypothetical protein